MLFWLSNKKTFAEVCRFSNIKKWW